MECVLNLNNILKTAIVSRYGCYVVAELFFFSQINPDMSLSELIMWDIQMNPGSVSSNAETIKVPMWNLYQDFCKDSDPTTPITCTDCQLRNDPATITLIDQNNATDYGLCMPTYCTCPNGKNVATFEFLEQFSACVHANYEI